MVNFFVFVYCLASKKYKNENKVIILNLSKGVNFSFFNLSALSLMFIHATKRWGKQRLIDTMINNCNLKCTGSMLMSHLLNLSNDHVSGIFSHCFITLKLWPRIIQKSKHLYYLFFFKVTYKIKIKFGWRFWTNTLFYLR